MSDVRSEPIGRLVEQHPGWIAVLEEFGIDGRGGTSHTLLAAADRAGVSIELVVAALAGPPADEPECDRLERISLRRLIDHIERVHHRRTRELLARIIATATELGELAVFEAAAELVDDLEAHLEIEERLLFPLCRDLLDAFSWPSFHAGPVDRPLDAVHHDHQHLDDLVLAVRDLVPEGDDGVLLSVLLDDLSADLAVHLDEEEGILIPSMRRLAEDLATG